MITFLRNLVLEDFWLKLFSLMLAVLLWLTVSFASRKDTGFDQRVLSRMLPVTILASAEDVRSFRVSPSDVAVTVPAVSSGMPDLMSPPPDRTSVLPATMLKL